MRRLVVLFALCYAVLWVLSTAPQLTSTVLVELAALLATAWLALRRPWWL